MPLVQVAGLTSASAPFDLALQQGWIAAIIAAAGPQKLPWALKAFGGLDQPVVWIIVLPNPLFHVGTLAALVSIAGVAS